MKKVGEVLFLGAVTAVVGFCWKAGTYGATAVVNKIYDKVSPPKKPHTCPAEMIANLFGFDVNDGSDSPAERESTDNDGGDDVMAPDEPDEDQEVHD